MSQQGWQGGSSPGTPMHSDGTAQTPEDRLLVQAGREEQNVPFISASCWERSQTSGGFPAGRICERGRSVLAAGLGQLECTREGPTGWQRGKIRTGGGWGGEALCWSWVGTNRLSAQCRDHVSELQQLLLVITCMRSLLSPRTQ